MAATHTPIEWQGRPLAVLVESDENGRYLMPPVVIAPGGNILMGREVLEAIVQSGTPFWIPMVKDATPGLLAWIEQGLAEVSAELGVEVPKANYLERNEA